MKSVAFENGMNCFFSDLEEEILEQLWKNKTGHSKSLHEALKNKHEVSHITVAVTLNRLHERGMLARKPQKTRGGTRYIYTPKYSREAFGNHLSGKFLSFLRKSFGENCVANLKKRL